MKTYVFFVLFFLLENRIFAQNIFPNIKYQLATGAYISSSKETPFSFRSNQFGIVPQRSPFLTFRAKASKDYDSTLNINSKIKKFDWGFGGDFTTTVGKNSFFFLPEAYAKLRFKAWELYLGRRRETFGIVDSSLSSGSYIWSGNSLPIPKIQISIPNYQAIGKSIFYIKAGLNHGWFGNQGYVKKYFLHQKWLYGRIGRENAKVKAFGGVNHQVQWGGITQNTDPLYSDNGKLAPYPWYSYQFVMIPFLQKIIKLNPDKLTKYDSDLAIGNHLGSVDIGLEINHNKAVIMLYKQQPYDFARSLYNLNNIEDGLYGISLKPKNSKIIKKILYEYLHTSSQGLYRFGKYRPSNYVENDNYFSHGQYIAWQYNNQIIGTPYILINQDGKVYNNRVKAHSLFISGKLQGFDYLIGGTYSNNLGIYGIPLSKNQFSGKILTTYQLGRTSNLCSNIAYDIGHLYANTIGVNIIYQKFL